VNGLAVVPVPAVLPVSPVFPVPPVLSARSVDRSSSAAVRRRRRRTACRRGETEIWTQVASG
jgi:hypothetical protein